MRCPWCLATMSDGVSFCIGCGRPLRPSTAARFPLGYRNPYGGAVFGRYRMVGWVGEGDTSETFDAVEVATDRRVALRVVHKHVLRTTTFRPRFLEMAERLVDFDHPHVIRLLDAGVFEGMLFAVSELVSAPRADGAGGLPWPRVRTILTQLCDGLSPLHGRGIVHGRIEPAKLYLDSGAVRPPSQVDAGPYRRAPEVDDFVRLDLVPCLGHHSRAAYDPYGGGHAYKGYPPLPPMDHLSPEQMMGSPVDGRSDIYALGLVGYQLLVGELPFPDARNPSALLAAILKTSPPPPSQHADVPASCDAVILRCLDKDKQQRYDDVLTLRAALASA